MTSSSEQALGVLGERQRSLWFVAFLAYGSGDLVTTVIGLSERRAAEAGPLASAMFLSWGMPGLVVLKLLTLAGFYLLWLRLHTPGRVAVPLALAVVGVCVTLWNVAVLL